MTHIGGKVDGGIEAGIGDDTRGKPTGARRLVPIRVGEAAVYVEVSSEPPDVEEDGEIYPAVAKGPGDVFGEAGKILKEIVRATGEQVTTLGDKAKPEQVSVEFSLSFEAGAKAQLIPVLFTGETKATSGLKVTAVWGTSKERPQDA